MLIGTQGCSSFVLQTLLPVRLYSLKRQSKLALLHVETYMSQFPRGASEIFLYARNQAAEKSHITPPSSDLVNVLQELVAAGLV